MRLTALLPLLAAVPLFASPGVAAAAPGCFDSAAPLTVRPGGSTVAPTVAASRESNENPPVAQDIVPIKQRFGTLVANTQPLPLRPWFVALQGVPALAFAGALAWRKQAPAVVAIEERDGVRFYVEPGSALKPIQLIRTPWLRSRRTVS